MENCISDLRDWITSSKLKMNDDKTECMLLGTRQQLTKLSISHISVGDTTVATSRTVRNLGTLLDSNMSFHEHINKLSKSSFYFFTTLGKSVKYLTKDITATLVHAFVTCRLDYCNSVLYGLPAYQIAKIQRVRGAPEPIF